MPADLSSLTAVRDVIMQLAERAGFDEDEAGQIEIAVDEACANIIEHAYHDAKHPPPIRFVVQFDGKAFSVEMYDHGKPFSIDQHALPRFPDHWVNGNTRGVGLYIIKRCMDVCEHTRSPDGVNRLKLVKRLRRRGHA